MAIAELMLRRQMYAFDAESRQAFAEYLRRADPAAALRQRPQRPQRHRPHQAASGRPPGAAGRACSHARSCCASTPRTFARAGCSRARLTAFRTARRRQGAAMTMRHTRPIMLGHRGRQRGRQDDDHPRPGQHPRPGPRHPRLHRRLPQVRPGGAGAARDHAAASRTATTWTSWSCTWSGCTTASRSSSRSTTTATGTLVRPEYVRPSEFVIVEGLLGFSTPTMRQFYDVKVYLDPPEDLRRVWKIKRDTSKRGYTPRAGAGRAGSGASRTRGHFIRPQREHADIVVGFSPPERHRTR